jgi:hypothetical protein
MRRLCALALAVPMATQAATMERAQPVSADYFALVIHRAHTTTAWPVVDFGSWRLWDSYAKWSDVHLGPARFEFAGLDSQVTLGIARRKALFYTLGQTPRWASLRPDEKHAWGMGTGAMPSNLAYWREYVEAVSSRYKGRIGAYEIWNEPKYADAGGRCKGAIFFCGSAKDLVDLARVAAEVIRKNDPQALLVSPAFTDGVAGMQRLQQYLASGGRAYTDVIAVHLYSRQPEDALTTMRALREIMKAERVEHLPVWNTEVGFMVQSEDRSIAAGGPGPFEVVYSPEAAGELLVRSMTVAAATGLERVVWYAWDSKQMGAIDYKTGRPNAVATAYAAARRLLLGATLRCEFGTQPAAEGWECQLSRNGRQASFALLPKGSARSLSAPRDVTATDDDLQTVLNRISGRLVLRTADGKPW